MPDFSQPSDFKEMTASRQDSIEIVALMPKPTIIRNQDCVWEGERRKSGGIEKSFLRKKERFGEEFIEGR